MILFLNCANFEKLHFALIAKKLQQKKIKIKHSELEKSAEYLDLFLKANKVKLGNLSKIVVVVGKGSFTGVRLGVAIALAFSTVFNIPVFAIDQKSLPKNLLDLEKAKLEKIKAGYDPAYGAEPNITLS